MIITLPLLFTFTLLFAFTLLLNLVLLLWCWDLVLYVVHGVIYLVPGTWYVRAPLPYRLTFLLGYHYQVPGTNGFLRSVVCCSVEVGG